MDPNIVTAVSAVAGVLIAAAQGAVYLGIRNVVLSSQLKTSKEIADVKLETVQQIAQQSDDIKDWINGSFMRAKEVQARLDGLPCHQCSPRSEGRRQAMLEG